MLCRMQADFSSLKKRGIIFFISIFFISLKNGIILAVERLEKNDVTVAGATSVALPEEKKTLFHINSIRGVVFGADETHIITSMDLGRPSVFEGRMLSEKEYFLRCLIYEDSLNYKIPIGEDTIDKYLLSIRKEYNMTDQDIVRLMEDAFFTYEEGRKAIKMLYSANAVIGFKIQDRLIVAEDVVKKYYDEHPEFIEASYLIDVALVNVPEGKTAEDIKQELEEYKKEPMKFSMFSWSEPFLLKEAELADDKRVLINMDPGSVLIQENLLSFDLVRLKEKTVAHQRPLDDEYYQAIVNILRAPLLEELRKEYETNLWDRSAILYPRPASVLKEFNVIGFESKSKN